MSRNRVRDDLGKGREMLRVLRGEVALINGTARMFLGWLPASIRIQRISYAAAGGAPAGFVSLDVIAVPGADLSVAPGAGNRLMTQVTSIASAAVNTASLIEANRNVSADYCVVAVVVGNASSSGAIISVEVEYDVIGTSYGAYDGSPDAQGAYQ